MTVLPLISEIDNWKPSKDESRQRIREHILNHPVSERLRQQSGVSERWMNIDMPPALRAYNLTAGTLYGADMLEVPPLAFTYLSEGLPSAVQVMYLGSALCGHPGIVHGGMLATILDEGLARACFPAFPSNTGVTASLKIDYKAPCPAGSFIVLKAWTTKVKGRKAWCKGQIELLTEDDEAQGVLLAEAEGLFVEPKNVHTLARMNDW